MTTLLQELSKKLAERWAAVLIGPGLLFVACAVVAHHQGFRHALDLPELRRYVATLGTGRSTADMVVTGAVGTLGAATAGLVVAAASRFVQAVWIPTGPWWYVDALTRRRAGRWDRADAALTSASDAARERQARNRVLGRPPVSRFPAVRRHARRRSGIGEVRPDRPTWLAQRMADTAETIRRRYSLDLSRIWPHLWGVADSGIRADIESVQENYSAASRLAAWGAACLVLASVTFWWPAALLGVALMLIAHHRARSAVDSLAVLVVAAADLHVRDLAERFGVPCQGSFTAQTAAGVNAVLDADEGPSNA